MSLGGIIRAIKENDDIPNNLKNPLIEAYDNIANKTLIKYPKHIYNQYVLDPIMEIYINKDDDRSQRESETVEESTTETSDKEEDKSLKDELISNTLKTVNNIITGQGLNFDKIKIDENLLKKNVLKVRYINSNRKVNYKFLKEDYEISNNMKNIILRNSNLNKLSNNEYDVYNTLQKYRKKDDNLRLLLSSYLAGNKSKDLYNKINELLYKNYKNNAINKKQYQNIINKL